MLFEIKPVALKAMVVAVVEGVALWSVHSVPADPPDTPVINANDVTIGQVLDVGRLDGNVCIVTNDATQVNVSLHIDDGNGTARCLSSRHITRCMFDCASHYLGPLNNKGGANEN